MVVVGRGPEETDAAGVVETGDPVEVVGALSVGREQLALAEKHRPLAGPGRCCKASGHGKKGRQR